MSKITVLIADDELAPRETIKQAVDWEEQGFAIIGEATDGRQALEMAERLRPDVLIADIRMPFYNGLELLELLGQRGIELFAVMLTCYEDFSYIQTAMRCGAVGYITKHDYSQRDILELLGRLRSLWEQKSRLRQSESVLARSRLRSLVLAPAGESETVAEQAQGYWLASILCTASQRQEASSLLETFTAGGCRALAVFENREEVLALLGQSGAGGGDIAQELGRLLKGVPCFIGTSRPFSRLRDANRALQETEACLSFKIYFGQNQPIRFSDIAACVGEQFEAFSCQHYYKTFSGWVGTQAGDAKMKGELELLYRALVSRPRTDLYLLQFYHEFATVFRLIAEEHELTLAPPRVNGFTGLPEIMGELEAVAQRLNEMVLQCRKYSAKVLLAMRYMQQNYAEDVTLEDIARYVGISRIYLCQLFKKETGKNVIVSLQAIRIEKSKELLRDTEYKVYEVAQAVGFQNAQHYSSLFKKLTGLSPLEYRNRS